MLLNIPYVFDSINLFGFYLLSFYCADFINCDIFEDEFVDVLILLDPSFTIYIDFSYNFWRAFFNVCLLLVIKWVSVNDSCRYDAKVFLLNTFAE